MKKGQQAMKYFGVYDEASAMDDNGRYLAGARPTIWVTPFIRAGV